MIENAYMIGMKGKEKIKDWMLALVFLLIAIIALVIPYNSWFSGQKVFSDYHLINVSASDGLSYNELGDFVGGVIGTVVAGIACFLVFLTYKRQSETAETQQFESSFFNLIRIHKECLEAIQYNNPCIKQSVIDNDTDGMDATDLWDKYMNDKLEFEDYKEYFTEKQLQGESAMCSEFDKLRRPKEELKYFEKYFYSNWFNCICQIIKYLIVHNGKRFYVEFFYSQITRPEWWVLYDIFLNGRKYISDTEAFDDFANLVETELVEGKKMFVYGFFYLSKKYNVTRDNLYKKSIKHEYL